MSKDSGQTGDSVNRNSGTGRREDPMSQKFLFWEKIVDTEVDGLHVGPSPGSFIHDTYIEDERMKGRSLE